MDVSSVLHTWMGNCKKLFLHVHEHMLYITSTTDVLQDSDGKDALRLDALLLAVEAHGEYHLHC